MKSKLFSALPILVTAPAVASAQSSAGIPDEYKLPIAAMVAFYLLPAWIAWGRSHPSRGSIIAMNVLLGWTGVFWVWALIWSLGSKHKTAIIVSADGQPVPAATNQTTSSVSKSTADRIAELKAMLDSGTISKTEFELLKAEAFKGIS